MTILQTRINWLTNLASLPRKPWEAFTYVKSNTTPAIQTCYQATFHLTPRTHKALRASTGTGRDAFPAISVNKSYVMKHVPIKGSELKESKTKIRIKSEENIRLRNEQKLLENQKKKKKKKNRLTFCPKSFP